MPFSAELKALYERQLESAVQQCFGYHLVKLGPLSQQLILQSCQIKHQIGHSEQFGEPATVVSKATQLPYAEKSIDAFVLAHELDFTADPHQLLREVDHCLIPNGQLLVIGFNPYSLAGLARFLPFVKGNCLKQARFFSCSRVKDWLSLLGYEVTLEKRFLFADFVFSKNVRKAKPWHKFAQTYFSFFASVYLIVAKKRELPLSLIKPKWKPVPKFTPVGASLRVKPERS